MEHQLLRLAALALVAVATATTVLAGSAAADSPGVNRLHEQFIVPGTSGTSFGPEEISPVPVGCPEGWHWSVETTLRCINNTLTDRPAPLPDGPQELLPPPIGCPDGWRRAPNPALGCIPDTIRHPAPTVH